VDIGNEDNGSGQNSGEDVIEINEFRGEINGTFLD